MIARNDNNDDVGSTRNKYILDRGADSMMPALMHITICFDASEVKINSKQQQGYSAM